MTARAWKNMTNLEMYDAQRGITRDESGKALEITPVASWWNAGLIDGAHPDPVTLRPIYRFEDEEREFDEGDDTAREIVGFDEI